MDTKFARLINFLFFGGCSLLFGLAMLASIINSEGIALIVLYLTCSLLFVFTGCWLTLKPSEGRKHNFFSLDGWKDLVTVVRRRVVVCVKLRIRFFRKVFKLGPVYRRCIYSSTIGWFLFLCGAAIIIVQVGLYSFTGVWHSVSFATFLLALDSQWALEPHSWLGFWNILDLIPFVLIPWLAAIICFIDAANAIERYELELMRKKYENVGD